MADGSFPFPAIGLVHVANRIIQHRPIGHAERLDLEVRATPLQPHRRGRTFSIVSTAHVDGELVWEETSTMLRRGAQDSARATASAGSEPRRDESTQTTRTPSHSGPPQRQAAVAPAGRPRPPLCGGVGRSQPDPPARADREGAGLPARDRARHVDEGALPGRPAGRPRGPAPGRLRHRRELPPGDPAAGHSALRQRRRGRRRAALACAKRPLQGIHLAGRLRPLHGGSPANTSRQQEEAQ